MKTFLQIFIFTFFYFNIYSQVNDIKYSQDKEPRKFMIKSHDPNLKSFPEKSFYKQKADWQYIIDTTWGPGLPTVQKLALFDEAWNILNAKYAAYQGLDIDWDSIKAVYRPEVEAGVSRGRFAAIMNYMSLALQEFHTIIWDTPVMITPLNPGVPILYMGGNADNTSHFGATLTPLPDSTLLVLKTVSNHPLALQPGDIILGYDGILWKTLINELMSAQLPMYVTFSVPGGDKISFTHNILCGAGMNWHLFDTLDVVKYSTGDTLHFPTALLAGQNQFIWGNEQLTVPGVEWIFDGSYNLQDPKSFGDYISYGIIAGTNIGYIYTVAWADNFPGANISQEFYDAIYDLMLVQNVDGLIIDQRLNYGGKWQYQFGASLLFNSTFRLSGLDKRGPDPNNHYQMIPETQWDGYLTTIGSGATFFDRPIAVLIGPAAVSGGDMFPSVMKTHPMARLFGKPTNGSFSAHYGSQTLGGNSNWTMYYTGANGYMLHDSGNYLSHKAIIPDEEVWFTADGVANGQDDVINRALEWINNLVYPHNTITDKMTYLSVGDTVHLSTIIENPNSHQLSARAYLKTLENALIDSVDLIKQMLNMSGELWKADINVQQGEEFYKIDLTVFDNTMLDQFNVPNATRFTTAGPVVLDSVSITKVFNYFSVKPFIKNQSTVTSITNASVTLICNDSWITSITPTTKSLANIPPGATVSPSTGFTVKVDSAFSDYFNFRVEVMSDVWPYWADSMQVIVTGVEEEQIDEVPTEFLLSQNYPNPFNGTSVIKYSIPKLSQVTLKIFNTLGENIETLVNEEKSVGNYEVTFNAADLPSGVYIYRMKAGSFVQTRKMILLK